MRWISMLVSIMMIGMGCATCPDVRQQLDECQNSRSEQDRLIARKESIIRQKDQTIEEQKKNIKMLEQKVAEINRRLNISSEEKSCYDERIRRISSSVREFIKKQIRDERNFLTDIALEDFVGNPLISRKNTDDANNMIIIDVAHPIPGQGQINGIGGYFTDSCEIHIKLLRPVGNDYIVTCNKPITVDATDAGKQHIDFKQPVMARKGDIVAYYFSGPVSVPFDVDLGINSYFKTDAEEYQNGDRIEADAIWQSDQDKRKYSLNYYGIFNTKVNESKK